MRGDESALRAWVLTIAHHQLVQRRGNGVAGVQPAPGGAGRTRLADSEQERVNTMLTGWELFNVEKIYGSAVRNRNQ